MRALTLLEPWASLISHGVKQVETRPWRTHHRGLLAIHAGKSPRLGGGIPRSQFLRLEEALVGAGMRCVCGHAEHAPAFGCTTGFCSCLNRRLDYPLGSVVATCRVVACVPTEEVQWVEPAELDGAAWATGTRAVVAITQAIYGNFQPGRFAWMLGAIEPLAEPQPARGWQGLWLWEPAAASTQGRG